MAKLMKTGSLRCHFLISTFCPVMYIYKLTAIVCRLSAQIVFVVNFPPLRFDESRLALIDSRLIIVSLEGRVTDGFSVVQRGSRL